MRVFLTVFFLFTNVVLAKQPIHNNTSLMEKDCFVQENIIKKLSKEVFNKKWDKKNIVAKKGYLSKVEEQFMMMPTYLKQEAVKNTFFPKGAGPKITKEEKKKIKKVIKNYMRIINLKLPFAACPASHLFGAKVLLNSIEYYSYNKEIKRVKSLLLKYVSSLGNSQPSFLIVAIRASIIKDIIMSIKKGNLVMSEKKSISMVEKKIKLARRKWKVITEKSSISLEERAFTGMKYEYNISSKIQKEITAISNSTSKALGLNQ